MSKPNMASQLYTAVVRIILQGGERLAILVDPATWLPKRVALRWTVNRRRLAVRPSTLYIDLLTIGRIYTWAWHVLDVDLDAYLTNGHVLNARQLESLAATLREMSPRLGQDDVPTVAGETYDRRLSIAEDFLTWALYPEHRGGTAVLTREQLSVEHEQINQRLRLLRIGAPTSKRIQPLTAEDMMRIRSILAPERAPDGHMIFPRTIFAPSTRLRNWLMVEMALELGIRRSEMLKIHLDSLPRGAADFIKIEQHRHDPLDSRRNEPGVKTAERVIPMSMQLRRNLRAYLTTLPPLGRKNGASPYLFTSQTGKPLSIDTAATIIEMIGQASSVIPLSWHRFRHTWAEAWAEEYFNEAQALQKLMYLGGWTDESSALHYIEKARAKQAQVLTRARNARLYGSDEEMSDDDSNVV